MQLLYRSTLPPRRYFEVYLWHPSRSLGLALHFYLRCGFYFDTYYSKDEGMYTHLRPYACQITDDYQYGLLHSHILTFACHFQLASKQKNLS